MQDAAANHSSYSCFKEEEHQNPTCLNHHHDPQQLRGEDHERENSPSENGRDSPPSTTFGASSSSSPKRGKGIQKRVVTVPIKDVEGLRLKGESTTPPSDSWAWRKYGQKPIKGSPFPRGYYRCSSSKGCPARKQVERSCTSPCTLVITYSHEHNHSRPTSRNHHHHQQQQHSTTATKTSSTTPTTTPPPSTNITNTTGVLNTHPEINDTKPMISTATDFGDESLVTTDDFTWFSDVESTMSSTLPDRSSISSKTTTAAVDYDMITRLYPMREEDESLFADLGELPECSKMFGRGRPITAGVVQGGRRPSTVACKQLYNLV